ncbi:hypothetical protein T552_03526 [Pneumocystis carinii B80]|uniref:Oligopeptide transporter n=1 Tax=Pneumocystis carinii (strain B80) TaxID=1408658 RepID=A0A0W4ZBA0_PNEC8|nr:hypothetical protein T552_03526 [Pneumocystis carinii B80]KTW25666.1 hypothetical protein T552_03526 [Pneumocystis carinii B80]
MADTESEKLKRTAEEEKGREYEEGQEKVEKVEKDREKVEKKELEEEEKEEEKKLPGTYTDEKVQVPEGFEGDMFSLTYDIREGNPFPENPDAPKELHQLTIRALVVGSLLGSIVASSNIYLGLKTGFTFGAQLFGAIFGFAILRFISKVMPEWFGGGFFGPKENCTVQTAATAAGGMAGMFVSSIPAMYSLNLLGSGPEEDFWRLVSFTAVSAYYGLFFVIPLRRFYIIYQKLVFPTSSACALTIHSLHSGAVAHSVMKKKIWSLSISFLAAIVLRVCADYLPGILWDWHLFWWLYKAGWKGIIGAENWGWWIELTPAFFGVGFFSGLNAAASFFIGSVLSWAIIGPIISKTGIAPHYTVLSPEHPDWVSYSSMSLQSSLNPNGFDPIKSSSPRYWLLWPGVMLMLCSSFAEVIMNGPVLWLGLKRVILVLYYKLRRKEVPVFKNAIQDPAPPETQIPAWQWVPLLIVSIIFTCVVLTLQYDISVGLSLLAIFLGFLFSFIGAQSSGATDVNPVSICAKSSQLVFGSISSAQKMDEISAQRLNLIAGTVASSSASQSVDMIGDLKTGHLLGAYPKVQFYAQVIGSFFSIWISVALYILFDKAYPCFTTQFMPGYPNTQKCVFGAPSIASWRAVASAMTNERLPIPPSSGYTSIALGIIAAATVVFKYTYSPEKYRPFIPNFNAIGLGFVVPQTHYATVMFIGAIVAYFWKRAKPVSYDIYALSIATGFAAGEGMGGVLNAITQISGVSGSVYGSSVGCPYDSWCG